MRLQEWSREGSHRAAPDRWQDTLGQVHVDPRRHELSIGAELGHIETVTDHLLPEGVLLWLIWKVLLRSHSVAYRVNGGADTCCVLLRVWLLRYSSLEAIVFVGQRGKLSAQCLLACWL